MATQMKKVETFVENKVLQTASLVWLPSYLNNSYFLPKVSQLTG